MKKIIKIFKEEKRLDKLNIFLAILPILIYWKYDVTHHTFLRDNIQFTYIYMTGLMVFLGMFSFLGGQLSKYKVKVYFTLSSLIMIPGLVFFVDNATFFNKPMYYIFGFHFVQTILDHDNSPFWLMGFIIVASALLGIKFFWKSYIQKSSLDVSTQQIVNYGMLTYLILVPTIWIFTHFTYVTSNFFYMNVYTNIVNTIMEDRSIAKKTDNFKTFNNFEELKAHYLSSYESQQNKKGRLYQYLMEYESIRANNFNFPKMGYYDVASFDDWVDFTLNQRHKGYNSEKGIYYSYALFIPKEYDHEPLSHVIISIKENKDQSFTSYIAFDQSFKNLKKNYFFNVIYIIFHIAFIAFWLWIIRIHKKLKK